MGGRSYVGIRPQRMSGLIERHRLPWRTCSPVTAKRRWSMPWRSHSVSLRNAWLRPNGNPLPAAVADDYDAVEGKTLAVPWMHGVLLNDEGPATSAVLVETTAHGLLVLRDDGSFEYTPDANFNREVAFRYRASDGEYESDPATVAITVQTQHAWHNGLQPLDVSDDTFVSPIDALLCINGLNRAEGGKLPVDRPRPLTKPFYDVNRDGFLSPIDALQVINYLNRGGGEGEKDLTAPAPARLAASPASGLPSVSSSRDVVSYPTTASEQSALPPTCVTGCPAAKSVMEAQFWGDDNTEWRLEDLEEILAELVKGQLDL